MGEWEYKIVRLNENEHGIFVCRHTEWRLLLALKNVAISYDSHAGGLLPASDIARAMGWDRGGIAPRPLEPVDPVTVHAGNTLVRTYTTTADDAMRALKKEQDDAILEIAAKRARAGESVLPAKSPAPKAKRKSPVMTTVWTDAAVGLLRTLRAEALSYETISKKMTKELGTTFTSSMCSAKADRLGIPKIVSAGGRPPKVKIPEPAQDAKADKGEQIDGGSSRTPEAIVPSAAPGSNDAGANPAAGTMDLEGVTPDRLLGLAPLRVPLDDPAAGTMDLNEDAIASLNEQIVPTKGKKISVYPPSLHDSVGYFPYKPTLTEAVEWYRNQGNRVFKINGHMQVFEGSGEDHTMMTPNQFLMKVNDLRVRMALDPFEIAA